jgi:hypothetical protein
MRTLRQSFYETTRQFSESLGLERDFYLQTKILLSDNSLLDSVTKGLRGKGTSPGTASRVLRHVLARTLPFGKLIEYITAQEIARGMPALAIPDAGCSTIAVRRSLKVLIDLGYLVEVTSDWGRAKLLGLNLPVIAEKLNGYFRDVKIKEASTAWVQKDRAEKLSSFCNQLHSVYNYLKQWKQLAIFELERFLKGAVGLCKKAWEKMGNFTQNAVNGTQRKARGVSLRRMEKKAGVFMGERNNERVFFSNAGLSFWHLQVKLRPDRYPGYSAVSTKKVKGMMRNWMKELFEQGLESTEAQKEYMESLIDNWWRVANTPFLNYKNNASRVVPRTPDFEFFYTYRRELTYKLRLYVERPDPLKGKRKKLEGRLVDF